MNIGMSSDGLLGIRELFAKAWEVYKRRMPTLIVLGIAAVLLPVLCLAPFVGLGVVLSMSLPGMKGIAMFAGILLGTAAAVWSANWAFSAFLTAVADETCGVKEAFKQARPKILGHLWLAAVTGLILGGAHLLFIIPGLILTVWFFFAPFVFIHEDVRGMDALLKSKAYVKDRWAAVAVRLLAVWFVSALISAIPFVGPVVALFLVPFGFVYTFLLYKDLKGATGTFSFEPSKREKVGFVAAGTMGYALPVVLVLTFMGPMMQIPFSVLTASVTGQSPADIRPGRALAPTPKMPSPRSANTVQAPRPPSPRISNYINVLTDSSQGWTKRSQAAFQLGMSRDPEAVPALMQALKTDDQWVVRKNAVDALAALNARQAVDVLIGRLETDENVFVREAAVKALGQLGDRRAVGPLESALEDPAVVMTQKDGETVEEKTVAIAAQAALNRLKTAGKTTLTEVEEKKPENTASQVSEKALSPIPETIVAEQPDPPALDKETKAHLLQRIKACTKAIKIQPKDALAYHHRAVAHFKLGSYEKALEDFTAAATLTPAEAGIYYNRAATYAMLGRYTEAVEDGTKCIKLNPEFPDAYLNRGIDYLASGRMREALADFEKVTELNDKDAAAYYARGIAKLKLGATTEAGQDFKTAADMGNEKARKYLKTSGLLQSQT